MEKKHFWNTCKIHPRCVLNFSPLKKHLASINYLDFILASKVPREMYRVRHNAMILPFTMI